MNFRKKGFAIFVACCLMFSLIPSTALADSSYTPYSSTDRFTIKDGSGSERLYYDIFGIGNRDVDDSHKLLLQTLNKEVQSNKYECNKLYTHWDRLGGIVYGGNPDVIEYIDEQDDFDFYHDNFNWTNVTSNDGSLFIKNDINEIKKDIISYLGNEDNITTDNLTDDFNTSDLEEKQPMIYTITRTILNDSEKEDAHHLYLGYANIFYDFNLAYINTNEKLATGIPDDFSVDDDFTGGTLTAPGFTYTIGNLSKTYSTGVQNYSGETINAEQNYSVGYTNTVENQISNSIELGFQEMIGIENKVSAKMPILEIGAESTNRFEFTASQVFSSTTSKTTSNSETNTVDSTVSIPLPANTEVLLEQSRSTNSMTIEYDYPVAITYKVKTVGIWGRPEKNQQKTIKLLATFGRDDKVGQSDAVDNLFSRWNSSSMESMHGDNINWADHITRIRGKESKVFTNLATYTVLNNADSHLSGAQTFYVLNFHRPMSITGGTLDSTSEGFASKVYGIVPIYPLKKITIDGRKSYQMKAGESLDVDDIDLKGLNINNIPYYGFNSAYGHWVLVDSFGNEISESYKDSAGNTVIENDVAALVTDRISNEINLKAKNKDGTVYLKYMIDENQYSYSQESSFITNKSLDKTAVVTVKVKSDPVVKSQLNYSLSSKTYNGKHQGVNVTPKSGTGKVTAVYYTGTGGTQYAKTTVKPVNAGYYSVSVDVAKGTNCDAANNLLLGTFQIKKANLSNINVKVPDVTWSDKKTKPKAFKYNGIWYTVKSNATVDSYGSNKNIGTGYVKLIGKGNFTGKKTVKFKILPKKTGITKFTTGDKQISVTWKKASSAQNVTKYQVRYRAVGSTKWTVKNYKSTSVSSTIQNLKKGKKYQVQVRSVKKVSGKNYYSGWSKVKTSKKV